MPQKMKEILNDAKAAQAKLIIEGMKVLKKLGGPEDKFYKQIKHCVSNATNSSSALEHIITFQEMPDETRISKANVDKLLYDTGCLVETFNEVIEMAKGSIKARG
jgi:beta-N-acetylglucosaminidase